MSEWRPRSKEAVELLERLVAGEPLSDEDRRRLDAEPELAQRARELLGVVEFLERGSSSSDGSERTEPSVEGASAREDLAVEAVRRALGPDRRAPTPELAAAPRIWRPLAGVAAAASILFCVFVFTSGPDDDPAPEAVLLSTPNGFRVTPAERVATGEVRVHWDFALDPGGSYEARLWPANGDRSGVPLATSDTLDEPTWILDENDVADLPQTVELEISALDAFGELIDVCIVPYRLP